MSRVVYYLGAGASYGEPRDYFNNLSQGRTEVFIKSGLPVVNEITDRLVSFQEYVNGMVVPNKSYFEIWNISVQSTKDAIELIKQELLNDITWLHNESLKHATVDTLAKKLYLVGNMKDFKRLEKVLCLYLVWEQLDHRGDQRYDTFLASVLTKDKLQLPKDISVISWNYDSQFEMAYLNYSNKQLFVFDKYSEVDVLPDCGRIFKVNGSASFRARPTVLEMLSEQKDKGMALLMYYSHCSIQVDLAGFEQIQPRLSFAWDQEDRVNVSMMNAVKDTVSDAKALVVIGYSFPFYNRSVDREIFSYMDGLETIYIQDPAADEIRQNIQNVLSDIQKVQSVEVLTKTNCSQFFLPPEL